VKLYVDGGSPFTATASSTGIRSVSSVEATIGAISGGSALRLEGTLDEIAVWDSDQSANASTIYNGGVPNDISSLSPISWWRCGDGDVSPILTDNGSGGNNGTMTNFSTFSTDVPFNYKSILLDGIDDYVDCGLGLGNSQGTITNFSVSMWIKPSVTSGNDLFFNIGNFSNSFGEIAFQLLSNNLFIKIDNSAYRVWVPYTNTSAWEHLAFVYDGSNSANTKMYINGVLQSPSTGGVYPSSLNLSGLKTIIGAGYSVSYPYSGLQDEVSYFNTTLSQSDINTIYGGGTPSDISSISGLVSWWRFEGSGTTATDSGSGGNDGTLINGVTRSADVPIPFTNTKSILLDGVDDYVDIGNPSNLSTITSISISAWFKTTDTVGGLVIVGSDDQIQGRRYILRTESSNGIKLRFFSFSSNGSFDDIIGTTNINDGQWHHVMAINNGTNLKIYIDGVLDNSNTNGNLINTTFATPNINIGRRSYSGNENYFDGLIDEVAIWSSDQSANASAIGGTIPTDLSTYNPLGWWRCGDGDTSPTLTDNGSGGNDGTMTNFTTFSTDVPT
jgi:hypothetical protein